MTMTLGTLSQIVRINANTVTTYQTWTERQEIPFSTSSFKNIESINIHFVENT